ncbi:MAG: 2,3-bisphosphoglycerate-independent phosphoglycerate mutase [Pseudomonadota bacterium]
MQTKKPILLVILDGFGISDNHEHNAIYTANTPVLDEIYNTALHTVISGSGEDVGLPDEQMGNSEVGHLNMGAGRIVYQDYTRINKAIEDGEFAANPVFNQTFEQLKSSAKTLHIFGLLSPGGVHSHEQQIFALVRLAASKGIEKICLHAFLDGRDTPPRSALNSLVAAEKLFQELNCGRVASISGRYYAMDRDKRWDRIHLVYNMLTLAASQYTASNASEALEAAYARGETDEFVQPTLIDAKNKLSGKINDGDAIIFMNFRADRARQLTRAFTEADFPGFERDILPGLSAFICLTQYAQDIRASVAFPPEHPQNTLGEYLANLGCHQLRIAETEKYAHVTFFFNGGIETPYLNEDRILVPSPKVATYDLQPEMSANAMTDQLIAALETKKYDFIVCNFANADMVGHSGNFAATVKAIETIDNCLGRIKQTIKTVDGEMIITADHGNAEKMFNPQTGQPHTAHTNEAVPFIFIGRPAKICLAHGKLSDIAPTILKLMNLTVPQEMTGQPIIETL